MIVLATHSLCDCHNQFIVAVSLTAFHSVSFLSRVNLLALLYRLKLSSALQIQVMAIFTVLGLGEYGLRPLCSSEAYDCMI